MDASKKHQVSLRGASAKEITRDALLEKVSHERELRNFARRTTAAALFIQRVWRRYHVTKKLALQLQEEWEVLLGDSPDLITKTYISSTILRPFLFFITRLSVWVHKLLSRDMECIRRCFYLLLESLKSTDPNRNFCSLAIGIPEERKIWTYQVKRLISLCSFVIGESKLYESVDTDAITSIVVRLLVTLTDLNGWRCIIDRDRPDAEKVLRGLIWFMGSDKGGLYKSVGRYVSKLNASVLSKGKVPVLAPNIHLTKPTSIKPDDKFLTTASIITIALRPFLVVEVDARDPLPIDMKYAAEQYCIYVLSVPWLVQRIPSVLLPALRHKTILERCFRILLISNGNVFTEYSLMDRSGDHCYPQRIPRVGWALSNIISLSTGCQNDTCRFSDGVDILTYIRVLNNLTHHFLSRIESLGWTEKTLCYNGDDGSSSELVETLYGNADMDFGSIKYLDLFSPVCQQWHLMKLLNAAERHTIENKSEASKSNCKGADRLKLLDIAYLYSYMMRIYSILNMTMGSAPVLNMLSFTPGFLVKLWGELEGALFLRKQQDSIEISSYNDRTSTNLSRGASEKMQKQKKASKEPASKWVSTLNKITGKSQADKADMVQAHTSDHLDIHDSDDLWDVECLRGGPTNISKDTSCLLQLFCAAYAHLLLILDDIEFYERQVPFSLEQQQKIASVLNTLVYNGLSQNHGSNNRALMESAIRCLQMLYERDCRHQFCPLDLWLAPGRKSRPPIATAARVHEAYLAKQDDSLNNTMLGSFITTTPYVYPFDERVQMFRELIKMDKSTRKMAGELMGPGDRAIEIVIRRGHIVEDGYRQLNSLGSKLKSTIHVSFVSECGLPEAGLDYGGLSKEFLTDLVKAGFDPEYGLFCQTLTSERHLIPSSTARFQENGIQMIEFFGRIVGKVLYEEFLLDFSFSHVFVQKLLGRYSFLDELSALDPELYKNLMYVKHYDGDVMELSLDFTVTEESFGKRHIIELKPGGKNTTVTNENKLQYIHAMADYKLNRQILPLSNAFYQGLTDLISPSWLKLFNASEFNQLLSGGNIDIDVDDLRRNTRYTGGYSEGSRAVKLFWEVMTDFEPKERCMVLKFVTSCSRAPLLGFKYLQPTFTIHKVPCDVPIWVAFGGQDVERLPSASTCYNTLKLPTYKRGSTLRAKLLYAINSNAGFELS